MNRDVFPALEQVEFDWRGATLSVRRDPQSGRWMDGKGQVVEAQDVLDRLNCPEIPKPVVSALLTMDWSNGELMAFYKSKAFHEAAVFYESKTFQERPQFKLPETTGDGQGHQFMPIRQRFHFMGGGWTSGEYEVVVYMLWALIWLIAGWLIWLSFRVDRRNPSKKKPAATLPA
ncbi:MAG: hypothetical protein ACNA8P_09730 [Phycisphaerales bacterium]